MPQRGGRGGVGGRGARLIEQEALCKGRLRLPG